MLRLRMKLSFGGSGGGGAPFNFLLLLVFFLSRPRKKPNGSGCGGGWSRFESCSSRHRLQLHSFPQGQFFLKFNGILARLAQRVMLRNCSLHFFSSNNQVAAATVACSIDNDAVLHNLCCALSSKACVCVCGFLFWRKDRLTDYKLLFASLNLTFFFFVFVFIYLIFFLLLLLLASFTIKRFHCPTLHKTLLRLSSTISRYICLNVWYLNLKKKKWQTYVCLIY